MIQCTPQDSTQPYTAQNYGTPGAFNVSCGEIADGPPPMSYETDIRPIFVQYCAPCHTTACLGGGCWDSYEDLTELSAYSCGTNADGEPLTKGECTTIRVHNGSMPQGVGCKGDGEKDKDKPECLTGEELLMLQWWVEGGMQP